MLPQLKISLVAWFFHATCSIGHFHPATKSVKVSGAQRMMGTHEPMMSIVPSYLFSALLWLKNLLFKTM